VGGNQLIEKKFRWWAFLPYNKTNRKEEKKTSNSSLKSIEVRDI